MVVQCVFGFFGVVGGDGIDDGLMFIKVDRIVFFGCQCGVCYQCYVVMYQIKLLYQVVVM